MRRAAWGAALGCLLCAAASAQAPPPAPGGVPGVAPAANACPTPAEVTPAHLYGLWRAEFSGGAPAATLLLEKHPDFEGNVRGGIDRDGAKGQVAGDVDDGEFNLDESDDGIRIAANWTGTVVENSCGKEIRGTWTASAGKPEYGFVLRKVPGWQ